MFAAGGVCGGKKGWIVGLALLALLWGWSPTLVAQNAPAVQSAPRKATPHWRCPLISQTSRDGLLLGCELRLSVVLGDLNWEPGLGAIYGFGSRAIYYRYSLSIASLLSLGYRDWPGSLVLGREGERGLHLGLEWQGVSLNGFYGTLWPTPREAQAPAVGYLQLNRQFQWTLPLGARLRLQGEALLGWRLAAPPAEYFRTLLGSAQLELGHTTVRLQLGRLANPAGLADLRFRFSLRSYPATLQGDRILVASLERRFDLWTIHFAAIDLSRLLGLPLGRVPVLLRTQGALFFEGGEVWLDGVAQGGVLFGWGVALLFPDLDLRLDAAFNAAGRPRLHLSGALLNF